MSITIKEFNTYQNYCKLYDYEKILCSFCYSNIIPIEYEEYMESVKCIYCNTIMTLNIQTINQIKLFIEKLQLSN